jgi:hypothetical protein
MATVTRQQVADKMMDYLNHRLSLSQLVDWAEEAMREGDFDSRDHETIRDIVSRLGLADVKAFGLTWEDCENFLRRLGYRTRVEATTASHQS